MTPTPKLDHPLQVLRKERDTLYGKLVNSLKDRGEDSVAEEADALMKVQQLRRAENILAQANGMIQMPRATRQTEVSLTEEDLKSA